MALPFLTVIAKEALYQLTNKLVLAKTVSTDYQTAISTHGQTVTVVLPETPTVQAAGGAFAPVAASPSTVNVSLNNWKETVPIKVDSKTASMAEVDVLSLYATPIANALASDIEKAIDSVAQTFTGSVGVNGTAPTGFGPLASDLKAKFDTALTIPDSDRYVVLGPGAETEWWKIFGLYNNSGNTGEQQQITGQLGQKLGMNYVGSPLATGTNIGGYCYHKSAILFASRPMQVSPLANPGTMVSVNYNGIGLTVEAWRDPNSAADYIRGQILYGVTKALDSRGFIIKK